RDSQVMWDAVERLAFHASRRSVRINPHSALKRAFDIAFSLTAIIFCAPMLLALYFLVRSDGGPGVFVQPRLGLGGRTFPCFKFRTMAVDAEARLAGLLDANPDLRVQWELSRKLSPDPRVTRFGVFLREKSLDELPQLFNILRGEMSVVGPRPIVSEERAQYGPDFAFYMSARPGLTGLWQVSGRSDLSYPDRVKLDVAYVETWTFWKDLKIVLRTFGVVAGGRGAR
ncbi:MAG: sugar transferase, partial [Parvularculaceae bacterium]|nr:sugar transferase [Parvularculaceae bacterium]